MNNDIYLNERNQKMNYNNIYNINDYSTNIVNQINTKTQIPTTQKKYNLNINRTNNDPNYSTYNYASNIKHNMINNNNNKSDQKIINNNNINNNRQKKILLDNNKQNFNGGNGNQLIEIQKRFDILQNKINHLQNVYNELGTESYSPKFQETTYTPKFNTNYNNIKDNINNNNNNILDERYNYNNQNLIDLNALNAIHNRMKNVNPRSSLIKKITGYRTSLTNSNNNNNYNNKTNYTAINNNIINSTNNAKINNNYNKSNNTNNVKNNNYNKLNNNNVKNNNNYNMIYNNNNFNNNYNRMRNAYNNSPSNNFNRNNVQNKNINMRLNNNNLNSNKIKRPNFNNLSKFPNEPEQISDFEDYDFNNKTFNFSDSNEFKNEFLLDKNNNIQNKNNSKNFRFYKNYNNSGTNIINNVNNMNNYSNKSKLNTYNSNVVNKNFVLNNNKNGEDEVSSDELSDIADEIIDTFQSNNLSENDKNVFPNTNKEMLNNYQINSKSILSKNNIANTLNNQQFNKEKYNMNNTYINNNLNHQNVVFNNNKDNNLSNISNKYFQKNEGEIGITRPSNSYDNSFLINNLVQNEHFSKKIDKKDMNQLNNINSNNLIKGQENAYNYINLETKNQNAEKNKIINNNFQNNDLNLGNVNNIINNNINNYVSNNITNNIFTNINNNNVNNINNNDINNINTNFNINNIKNVNKIDNDIQQSLIEQKDVVNKINNINVMKSLIIINNNDSNNNIIGNQTQLTQKQNENDINLININKDFKNELNPQNNLNQAKVDNSSLMPKVSYSKDNELLSESKNTENNNLLLNNLVINESEHKSLEDTNKSTMNNELESKESKEKLKKGRRIEINLDKNIYFHYKIQSSLTDYYEIYNKNHERINMKKNFMDLDDYMKILKSKDKLKPRIKKYDKNKIYVNKDYANAEDLSERDIIPDLYEEEEDDIRSLEKSLERSIDKSFDKSYDKWYGHSLNDKINDVSGSISDSYNLTESQNKGRKLINQLNQMFIEEVDERDENDEK